jgi:hypothetical protein
MKVLFDQGVPVPLRRQLPGHQIDTLFERGWSSLANGELLDAGEADGYEVLVSTDQNIKHQQNLAGRRIGVVILLSTAWPRIRHRLPAIVAALASVRPGTVVEVEI